MNDELLDTVALRLRHIQAMQLVSDVPEHERHELFWHVIAPTPRLYEASLLAAQEWLDRRSGTRQRGEEAKAA